MCYPWSLNSAAENSSPKQTALMQSSRNKKAFFRAAKKGDLATLKLTLSQGAQPDTLSKEGTTALHYAAENGHADIAAYVLKKCIDVHIKNLEDDTALHTSCRNGHFAVTNVLLLHGADPCKTGEGGATPLHYAVIMGHLPIVKLLTTYPVDINAVDIRDKETPLHLACANQNLPIVAHLLSAQANPNAQNIRGQTPLLFACHAGHLAIIKLLLSHKADPEIRSGSGESPLARAWRKRRNHVVNYLTGLPVIQNELGYPVPADGNDAASGTDTLPNWKRLMCDGYVKPLAPEIEKIALETAKALEIENVLFFLTNQETCHASMLGFPHIGIDDSTVDCAQNATYHQNSLKPRNGYAQRFKHAVYHELCHIKGKHMSEMIAPGQKTPPRYLTNEMEAELGATYYLYTIDGLIYFFSAFEDDSHPSEREHWRYQAQLYDTLHKKPKTDYSIVKELAELYLKEKNTGTPMIKDSILKKVAKRFFRKKMLSREIFDRLCENEKPTNNAVANSSAASSSAI